MANDTYNNNLGAELSWDDTISEESSWELLEPGTYDFVVNSFERKRYNGSAKMCACNMIELSLSIEGQTVKDRLYMNKKAEWRLSQFLVSIGMKQKGVPCKPNWNAIPGACGRCELGVRVYKKDNGNENEYNEVKAYLKPEGGQASPPAPAPAPQAYQQQRMAGYPAVGHWQPGKF